MARQVMVVEWCDVCLGADLHVAATWTAVIRIGELERELMVCEDHYHTVIGELPLLLEKFGTRLDAPPPHTAKPREPGLVTKRRKKYQEVACPVCGITRSSASVVADHIFRDHIGRTRPAAQTVCPDCDWTPKPTAMNPRSAVGKHRQVMHGFEPVTDAMAALLAYQSPVIDAPVVEEPGTVWFSQAEAAVRAGVNRDVIQGCVRRGTLASIHTDDGHIRISEAALVQWIRERDQA
jgi:hypothetical protein